MAYARGSHRQPAFSLVDLLVSIAVVAVLIGLLMPSMATVREATRRVVCSSNIRQNGLALAIYEEDYRRFPPSMFLTPADDPRPERMMEVRPIGENGLVQWDGLGMLFAYDYLPAAGVFYCPSHTGDHPLSRYADRWNQPEGEIVSNYHFRGPVPPWPRRLDRDYNPSTAALITDGMRTRNDYNHKVGANVLRADQSLSWFDDADGRLVNALPQTLDDIVSADRFEVVWESIDRNDPPPIVP